MNIGLYNRDTHVVVPKEPTEAMLSCKSYRDGDWSRRNYEAVLAAVPPHGAAMPTWMEIAYALAKVQGYDKPLPHTHYELADAVLALLAAKLK